VIGSLVFMNEPNVNATWEIEKESLHSHLTRQDIWRVWYRNLSLVEVIEYHLKELPLEFRTRKNCHVQALISLKGDEYLKSQWGMK